MAIDSFKDDYAFLSNFYPCVVEYDGEYYNSVEHAYQAAKTVIPSERQSIRFAKSAAQAKKLGFTATLRNEWCELFKLDTMEELLKKKFSNPDLKQKLLATGKEELIEGNWWGDVFWGQCNGVGENHLGKLLMKIRGSL